MPFPVKHRELENPVDVFDKPPSLRGDLALVLRFSRSLPKLIASDIEQELSQGTAFLFVPVCLGLGTIFYFLLDFEPATLPLVAAIICIALARQYALRIGSNGLVLAAILFTLLGAASAKFQTFRLSTPMVGDQISSQVEARVITIDDAAKGKRALLEILSTTKPKLKYAPDLIHVTLRNVPIGVKAGDIIQSRILMQPPSGPVRPGSYDFAFQSYFDGIGANGFSMGAITQLPPRSATTLQSINFAIENLRQNIATRIKAFVPGINGVVAAALVSGVTAGIDDDTNEAMRVSGLAHIISISGLHMALVAGVFLVAIRLLLSLFPGFASRQPVKKYAAVLALVASLFYLLLSGYGVATMRSFIMLAVMLLAVVFDRQALTMRNLAISATLILLVTPHEVMGPSFQMSFAATAALIASFAWWSNHRRGKTAAPRHSGIMSLLEKSFKVVVGLAVTSIIAGFATSLYSAWHFHRAAPMGLPANLAAMPAVSLIIMPAAVVSMLAMPFGLDEWPVKIMGEGVDMMLSIARYFASISPTGITGAMTPTALAVTSVCLVLACVLQTRLKLVALLLAPLSLYILATPSFPKILISEDARLVAIPRDNGSLAVNRKRPNSFTLETWQKATMTQKIIKPFFDAPEDPLSDGIFLCEPGTCRATIQGKSIVWLEDPTPPKWFDPARPTDFPWQAKQDPPKTKSKRKPYVAPAAIPVRLERACLTADIIILDAPLPKGLCKTSKSLIITQAQLAKQGSAEIRFDNVNNSINAKTDTNYEPKLNTGPLQITFALGPQFGEPNRPWSDNRHFSRAARNRPAFVPIPRAKKPATDNAPDSTSPEASNDANQTGPDAPNRAKQDKSKTMPPMTGNKLSYTAG
jgi:ComEC/Rec2-related protein